MPPRGGVVACGTDNVMAALPGASPRRRERRGRINNDDQRRPGIGSNAATLARSQARSDKVEADLAVHPDKWRILTGDRPTGSLHIGHYFGSLANRVRLQNKGIESFLVVADYQVIYDRDGVGDLQANVMSNVADYLAIGIDPTLTTIFTHSALPALNQLLLPFCLW